MKKVLSSLAASACVLLFSQAANAIPIPIVTFDTTLASPNSTNSGLSWYDGTGNAGVQGGFTTAVENGIELGLRAKLRQGGVIDDPTSDLYVVPSGAQPGAPTRAAWNYEFSIDLRPGGVGSLTLSGIDAILTITDSEGDVMTVNLLDPSSPNFAFPDDALYGPSGKETADQTSVPNFLASFATDKASDWGLQNSENPVFDPFPGSLHYNLSTIDNYTIDLVVSNHSTHAILDSAEIQVDIAATPEPGSMVLLGTGLLGFAGMIRRKIAK